MSSPALGCAQNADGSLKPAEEIEWSFSRDSSPVLEFAPAQPQQPAQTGKAPKVKFNHVRRPITNAIHKATPKRRQLTNEVRLMILDYWHANRKKNPKFKQTQCAAHFSNRFPNLKQSTISKLIKDEDKIRASVASNPALRAYKHVEPKLKFPELDKALAIWVNNAVDSGLTVNGPTIRAQAREFAQQLNIDEGNLKLSNGWLDSAKDRMNLHQIVRHGEAASISPEAVALARSETQQVLKGYALRDIYNMDETGLFYSMAPDRTLASRQLSGVKADKVRITVALCTNADGSDIRTPLFIGHSRKPKCCKGRTPGQLGFYYFHNKSAWMMSSIFQVFLRDFDNDMRCEGRKVLLLIDNAPSHKDKDNDGNQIELTNVTLVRLKPNMTAHTQPMDGGIIASFKSHFQNLKIQRALRIFTRHIEERNGTSNSAGQLPNPYKIDVLEAMRMATSAWEQVTQETVANCWQHVKILPGAEGAVPTERYMDSTSLDVLEDSLNELAEIAIAPIGVPTTEELINVPSEEITEAPLSNEDILDMVRDETEDPEDDSVVEVEPVVSLRAGLHAVLDLDTLISQKWPGQFRVLCLELQKMRRMIRIEVQATATQTDIRQFFLK